MNIIIDCFANILGYIMNIIYQICKSYGVTILIFTIFSKIILFPISIMIQKNSIKMVGMKPKIEELKMKYEGDKEAFMDAQIELFEKEEYHPSMRFSSIINSNPNNIGIDKSYRKSK